MFILLSEARRLFPPTVALFFCVLSLIEFCPQVGCHSGHVDLSPTTPPGEKDFCLNTENSGEMSGMRMVEKIKTTVDELVIDFFGIELQIPLRVPPCIKMVDAAVSEKLEAGFQKLQEATNCKSLLKKHLSREIFDKIKDLKTSFGSTLLDVIQSGKC